MIQLDESKCVEQQMNSGAYIQTSYLVYKKINIDCLYFVVVFVGDWLEGAAASSEWFSKSSTKQEVTGSC